ncbi:hypothetical protein JB92DRAFT_2832653 [Gautieria morchelliformis]|nr:hypothetical protein JB92DRAFT_2832653 [Gautieria morchelliformis]
MSCLPPAARRPSPHILLLICHSLIRAFTPIWYLLNNGSERKRSSMAVAVELKNRSSFCTLKKPKLLLETGTVSGHRTGPKHPKTILDKSLISRWLVSKVTHLLHPTYEGLTTQTCVSSTSPNPLVSVVITQVLPPTNIILASVSESQFPYTMETYNNPQGIWQVAFVI